MNITELLEKMVDTDIKHIMVNISTIIEDYPLFFIEYETSTKVAGYITCSDGKERFVIINKAHIVSISVVYAEDLEIPEEKADVMYE